MYDEEEEESLLWWDWLIGWLVDWCGECYRFGLLVNATGQRGMEEEEEEEEGAYLWGLGVGPWAMVWCFITWMRLEKGWTPGSNPIRIIRFLVYFFDWIYIWEQIMSSVFFVYSIIVYYGFRS